MKKKILFLLMIFIFVITICNSIYSRKDQLSQKEKVDDFNYLYNVIKDGYPYLDVNKRINNIDWLGNKDTYLERIKDTKNDKEFVEEISSIVSDLNNRHTEVINNKKRYELFKRAYSSNKLYDFLNSKVVVDRYKSIESKIKISKDDFSKKELITQDVIKNKVGYIYLPSMHSKSESTKKELDLIRNYIDKIGKYECLIIDIRGNKGGSDSYWQEIISYLTKTNINVEGYRIFRNNSKVIRNYTNAKNIQLENIENMPVKVKNNAPDETLKKFSDFEQAFYTIEAKSNNTFKGNVYLLIDEKVYSSSEFFSIFCKETGFATLIGNTTGGDGGGLDPVMFKLKNSGLLVRMSSGMYLNKDGICDEEFKTIPDFEIKNCKRSKNFKHDDCINKVLELENIN